MEGGVELCILGLVGEGRYEPFGAVVILVLLPAMLGVIRWWIHLRQTRDSPSGRDNRTNRD